MLSVREGERRRAKTPSANHCRPNGTTDRPLTTAPAYNRTKLAVGKTRIDSTEHEFIWWSSWELWQTLFAF